MDIAAFISELLEHENELIVPGLGTFYRSRVEGYYNKEQMQFYPPSLQLQFNADIKKDDGKLIGLLISEKQANNDTAKFYVDKFVADLLNHVNNESVTIGDLGTFSIRRGKLTFTARRLSNNNELFYGLVPAKLKRTKVHDESGTLKPINNTVAEKQSALAAPSLRGEPTPNAIHKDEVINEPTYINKPKRINTWVLILALLSLAGGIGLIVAYKYNPALFNNFNAINQPPPISDKLAKKRVSDSIENAIQAQKNLGVTPKVDSATLNKIVPPETPVDTFAIVIATFQSYNGASREYDRYSRNGLNVEIRKKPNDNHNRYQIDVAAYFSLDSAQNHLKEYKYRLKSSDLYIQTYPYQKK